MCTFMSISYKDVFIRVYCLHISHCILCMLYVQHMTHINGYIHILLYSVLFYYTVHVSGIKYKSYSKQIIAKKLCI